MEVEKMKKSSQKANCDTELCKSQDCNCHTDIECDCNCDCDCNCKSNNQLHKNADSKSSKKYNKKEGK